MIFPILDIAPQPERLVKKQSNQKVIIMSGIRSVQDTGDALKAVWMETAIFRNPSTIHASQTKMIPAMARTHVRFRND